MNIYDVKFYGAGYKYGDTECGLVLYSSQDEVHAVPGFDNFFFEVRLLRSYLGQKDVLKQTFSNGECEYKMLEEPFFVFKEGGWKKAKNHMLQEAFMAVFFKLLDKQS